MLNQVGIIKPGATWDSLPTSALGHHGCFADMDWGADPARHQTGLEWEVLAVKNTSGGTLTRATVVKFDTSNMFKYINATCGAGERGDGVVDPFVSTSGVPSNDFFNLVIKGPTKLTTANSTSIAANAALSTAASGRVLGQALGNSPYSVGYAMEAVAASATLFRAYVDFTGPQRAATGRMIAAGATLTVTAALHEGTIIALDTAAGSVVTLPAATGTGITYRFLVTVTATTNSHVIKVANTTDEFRGVVFQSASEATAPNSFWAADNDDTITLNRSTTGLAAQGEYFEITDATSGHFFVRGWSQANGSEATPFSAAV